MEELLFVPVETDCDIQNVVALADEIWHQHFTPIIGKSQVEYMLEHFQSYSSLFSQIHKNGYYYYLFQWRGKKIGYFAIRPETRKLFLSKIYLKQEFRGRKFSKKAVDFLVDFCNERGLCSIYLTVNRKNESSIAAYEAMGFRKIRTQVADIGGGFVMDDYVMEKIFA